MNHTALASSPPITKNKAPVGYIPIEYPTNIQMEYPKLKPTTPLKHDAVNDPFVGLNNIWDTMHVPASQPRLLHVGLHQILKRLYPEVDWSKLVQWRTWYCSRRQCGGNTSQLYKEDIETFLDYMLKFHPGNPRSQDEPPAISTDAFEVELMDYFQRYDVAILRYQQEVIRYKATANYLSGSSSEGSSGASKANVLVAYSPPQAPPPFGIVTNHGMAGGPYGPADDGDVECTRRGLFSQLVDRNLEKAEMRTTVMQGQEIHDNARPTVDAQRHKRLSARGPRDYWISTDRGVQSSCTKAIERKKESASVMRPSLRETLKAKEEIDAPSYSSTASDLHSGVEGSLQPANQVATALKSTVVSAQKLPQVTHTYQTKRKGFSPEEKAAIMAHLAAEDSTNVKSGNNHSKVSRHENRQSQTLNLPQVHPEGFELQTLQSNGSSKPKLPITTTNPSTRLVNNVQRDSSTRSFAHAKDSQASLMQIIYERGTPIGPETTPHLAMYTAERRKKESYAAQGNTDADESQ